MRRGFPRSPAHPFLVVLVLCGGLCLQAVVTAVPLHSGAHAQATAAERLKEADRLAAAHRGAEARTLYLAAAEQAHGESRIDLEALAFESLGRLLSGDSQYADAETYLARALPLAESLPDSRAVARIETTLGNVALNRGRYQEADAWYRKAAAVAERAGEQRLLGTALMNICLLDMTAEPERQSLQDRVQAIARSAGDVALEARVWHSRGDHDFSAGNLAQAMEELQKAASLYEKAGDAEDLATVFTSLGRVNRMHGLPLEAIPFYQKAYEIQRRADDRIGMIQSLNATGVAYAATGQHDTALTYYERAHALANESQSARAIAFMRGNLAGGLINVGQYNRAAELLEKLLQDGGDGYPSVRHSQLSAAYQELGRLPEARAHADQAVSLASGTQTIQALVRRANVRRRQDDAPGALGDLEKAAGLIEQLRQKLVPLDFMRQGFTTQYLGVYSEMIALHQGRGDAAKAIEAAEMARARAFLDLLATRAIIPPEAARPSGIDRLSEFAAASRTTLLAYWTTQSDVFIGVVAPGGVPKMARVALPAKRLSSLVQAVGPPAGGPTAATTSAARAAWRELYRTLIDPVREWLPPAGGRLAIIPEGALMRLPFAALTSPTGRYLVENYSLSYVPAGAFLNASAARAPTGATDRRFLLVADPRLPAASKGERPLPTLPGALEEVRGIARLLPAAATTLLNGEKATRPTVAGLMPAASVIHFATHGVVNDQVPLDSYLALAAGGEPDQGGRLTAQQLYGLHLRADLVVLSSCRSAGGDVAGEGISALARAFLSAGVPDVVASVWDVPDRPASSLVTTFYREWLRHESPAAALRAAQLKLIADLRGGKMTVHTVAGDVRLVESPALWAGFIVIGR
jgi:CHAT domain-containing protein/tetratricopeptide (TPR) repeat protein